MPKIKLDISKYTGDAEKRLKYISTSGVDAVFSDDFIQAHTDCKTFADFCKAIGCDTLVDNENLNAGNFDSAIKAHSKFSSWEDMFNTAFQALVDEK